MTSTPHWKQGWLLAVGSALALLGLAIEPSAKQGTTTTQTPQQPMGLSGYATADSNNRMIAVTGIDITGASILYLIDTVNPHLAVYQASGGSGSTQGVRLVGARNLTLDLQLDGLNDKSEYTFKDLEKQFADQELLPSDNR
jgi:hypothetical protein